MDKIINISSVGQDPALFQAKLNKNISIPPNSSIAVIGGMLGNNFTLNIDESNDTIAFLFGSGLGEIYDTLDQDTNGCDFYKPFIVKLKHGSFNTRFKAESTDIDPHTILSNLVESFNEQTPYKMIAMQGKYTTNSEISVYLYVPDFAFGTPNLYHAPNNLARMTYQTQATYMEVSDIAGGYIYESASEMVFPCANEIKGGLFKVEARQAVYSRFVIGMCLDYQITYRNDEEYDSLKDWVIPYSNEGGTLVQKPSNVNATNYRERLPFCVFVNDAGDFMIQTREVINNQEVGEVLDLMDSTIGENGQDTTIEVKTRCSVDANFKAIFQYEVSFISAGQVLATHLVGVPKSHMGQKLRLVGILDSNQNQTIDVYNVEPQHLLMDQSVGTVDETILSGAGNGNLDTTMIFNSIRKGTNIESVPGYYAGTDVAQISRKCNNLFFVSANNNSIIEGDKTTGDQQTLNLNTSGDALKQICHINITNLPINSEHCNNIRGNLTQTVFSTIVDGGEYSKDIQPYERLYVKLANKQPITISSLDIKITDSSGAIMESLVNVSQLFLHLKEGSVPTVQLLNAMTSKIKDLQDNFELFKQKPI